MAERPMRVRLDGIAMEVLGTLNGGCSFVMKRTWTRLENSSPSPSKSIASEREREILVALSSQGAEEEEKHQRPRERN